MDLPKMKNRIYQKKNSRFSKNYPKFYWVFSVAEITIAIEYGDFIEVKL